MSRRPRKSRRCKCYNDDKTPIDRGCPRLSQTCHFVHPDEPEWDTAESSSWLRRREELSEPMESGRYDPRRVKGITGDELEQLVRLQNRRLDYLDSSDNMDDEDDFDAHYQLSKAQQSASVEGRRPEPVAFTSARAQVPAPAPAIPVPSPSQRAPAPISQRVSVGSHIIEPPGTPPRPSARTPPPAMRIEAPQQTQAPTIAQPQPLKPKDPRLARLPSMKATLPVSGDPQRALPRLSTPSAASTSTPANAEATHQPSAETSLSPSTMPDRKPKHEHEEPEFVQPTPRRKAMQERALWDERIRLLHDTITTRNSLAALPTISEALPFIHPAASDASTPPADDPESVELHTRRAEAKHAYETALAAYLSSNAWPFSAEEMEVQVGIERQQREAGRVVGELRGVVERVRRLVLDERGKGPGREVRPPPVLQEGIGRAEGNEEEEKEEEADEEEMQMVFDPELAARLSPSPTEQSPFSPLPAADTARGVKRRRSPSEEPLPPSSFPVPPPSRPLSRTTPLFLPDDEDELGARPTASPPQLQPKSKQKHKPKPVPPPPPEADVAYTHLTDLDGMLSVLHNVLVEREREREVEVERLVGKKVRAAVRAEKGKGKGTERAWDEEGVDAGDRREGEGGEEDEGAMLQALEANIGATGVQLEELAGEVGNLIERTGEMEEGVAQVRARAQREGEWEWRFGDMEARLASLTSAHTSTERTLTALAAAVHAYTTSSPPTPPPPSPTADPIPAPDALLPLLTPHIKQTLHAHAQPLVDAFVKNVQGGVKMRQANTYATVWEMLGGTRRVVSAVVKAAGVEVRENDPGGAGGGS